MSKEVLYRAVSKKGKWIYGFYYCHKGLNEHFILPIDETPFYNGIPIIPKAISDYEVYKETVSEFTGLTDKNGTKIFEGDIVEMHYFFENHDPSTLGVFEDEDYVKGCLVYDELGLVLIDKNYEKHRVSDYVQEPCEELEVIGNIHDNPKLLEDL